MVALSCAVFGIACACSCPLGTPLKKWIMWEQLLFLVNWSQNLCSDVWKSLGRSSRVICHLVKKLVPLIGKIAVVWEQSKVPLRRHSTSHHITNNMTKPPDSSGATIESIVVDSKYFSTRRALHFLGFLLVHAIIPIAINFAGIVMPLYKPTSGFSVHNLSFVLWFGVVLPINSCFFLSAWTAYFCNETGLLPWTTTFPLVYGFHTLTLLVMQFGTWTVYFHETNSFHSWDGCRCLPVAFSVSARWGVQLVVNDCADVLLEFEDTKETQPRAHWPVQGVCDTLPFILLPHCSVFISTNRHRKTTNEQCCMPWAPPLTLLPLFCTCLRLLLQRRLYSKFLFREPTWLSPC